MKFQRNVVAALTALIPAAYTLRPKSLFGVKLSNAKHHQICPFFKGLTDDETRLPSIVDCAKLSKDMDVGRSEYLARLLSGLTGKTITREAAASFATFKKGANWTRHGELRDGAAALLASSLLASARLRLLRAGRLPVRPVPRPLACPLTLPRPPAPAAQRTRCGRRRSTPPAGRCR